MMLIILLLTYLTAVECIYMDRECREIGQVMNCDKLTGKDHYEGSTINVMIERIAFLRLQGTIDLQNFPNVGHITIAYGDVECAQIQNMKGDVELECGEQQPIICTNDDSTTTMTSETITSTESTRTTFTTNQWTTTEETTTMMTDRWTDKMTSEMANQTTEQLLTKKTAEIKTTDNHHQIIIIIIISIILAFVVSTIIVRCIFHRCRRRRTWMDIELGTLRRYHPHNSQEEIHFDVSGLKNE